MTASEFRAALRSLKIRQNWLADRLGVEESTISRWVNGTRPVPQYAVFAVSLIAQIMAAGKSVE